MRAEHVEITLDMMRDSLYSACVADAIDKVGLRRQSPRIPFQAMTGIHKLVGRCKTTLWLDFDYDDPNSYELELQAVDSCQPNDVVICAAQGSMRAASWGELLSQAARNAGAVGVSADGAVRDIAHMESMGFPNLDSPRPTSLCLNQNHVQVFRFSETILKLFHSPMIIHPEGIFLKSRID